MNGRAEAEAYERARYLTGLMWHVGAFLIINALFWILDLVLGRPGARWAYWITLFWGVALAFHVLAWAIDGRQVQRRRARRYAAEARRHDAGTDGERPGR